MMVQQFILNDDSRPSLFIVAQKSFRYDSMSIQISKVLDMENITLKENEYVVPCKYVYEEIDLDDMVVYAHYMDELNIRKNYSWANEM